MTKDKSLRTDAGKHAGKNKSNIAIPGDIYKTASGIIRKLSEQGFDDVIVNYAKSDSSQIKFANNKISATMNWENSGMGIFGATKKRIVSTTLKDFSQKVIDETLRKLVSFSKAVEPNKEYQGIADGKFKYKKIADTFDRKVMDNDPVDIVESGINLGLKNGAERVSGVMETDHFSTYMLTSNRLEAEEQGTNLYYSVRCLVGKEASGHKTACSRMLSKLNYNEAAQKAALLAVDCQNPQEFKEGKFDVLFAPLAFANLVDSFVSSASAFSVEASLSPFQGKLGKQVSSKDTCFLDDGTLPNGFNSSICDDEGYPTQRTEVVKDGILKTYLHNTSTAKRYNTASTGNAGVIAPSCTNIMLKPSAKTKTQTLQQMISRIKRGIYVTNVWYTRFNNHTTGDFSTIPRDALFYIENGKIKHAIKGIRVSDNLINIMKNISILGNDPEQIKSWETETPTTTPTVLVNDVNITRSKE